MNETNRTLLRYAGEGAAVDEFGGPKGNDGRADDDEEVVRLLRRWKRFNLVRGALALVGGLVAAAAVVYRS